MRTRLVLVSALLLAACGDGDGTSISINANDSGGALSAKADKDGTVAIDAPGFKGSFTLPKIKLDADDFDINGVKLPPGSAITAMNIEGGKGDNGGLNIHFRSPREIGAVRDWFAPKLADAGFTLTPSGNGLTGQTDDGKPFSLAMTAAGPGASEGVIKIGQ